MSLIIDLPTLNSRLLNSITLKFIKIESRFYGLDTHLRYNGSVLLVLIVLAFENPIAYASDELKTDAVQ